MPHAEYRNLSETNPDWGRIAVLPWDSDIFGFAVADYQPGDGFATAADARDAQRALHQWSTENSVELVSCSVPALDRRWRALLPAAGFYYVDSIFNFTITRPKDAKFRRPLPLPWLATAADQAAVEAVAERSFHTGRYHADPFFPAELANLRFRRWLANIFAELSDTTRVYLIGPRDAPTGFTAAVIYGIEASLPFGATDPSVHGTTAGYALFLGLVQDLGRLGVRRVVSKTSAVNTQMMNLAAYGGARFSQPHLVFHWHAPNAAHLLSHDNARP